MQVYKVIYVADIWNYQLTVQDTTSVILKYLCLQRHKKCKRYTQFKQNFNLQIKLATISASDSSQHQADHGTKKRKYLERK